LDLVLSDTWWRLPNWEMGYAAFWRPRRGPTTSEDPNATHRELVFDADFQEPVISEIGPILPEVLTLDLDDLEQLLGFVRRYGPLGIDEVALPEWEFMTREDTIREWVWGARRYGGEDVLEVAPPVPFMAHRTSVAGFQCAAGALQAGNAIARELLNPAGYSSYRLSEAWPDHTWWPEPPPNESTAKERLKWIVDLGLAFFSLSIEMADPAAPLFAAEPQHCLYARCCVELVESMNAGHPYRQCPRCGRYFSRRPDAIYCSDRCKKQVQAARHRTRHPKTATRGAQ
jgi:predicted nucleic acid-binding Zn ribbon protein